MEKNLPLEKEFEFAKRFHMLNTCLNAVEQQVVDEVDNSEGINIPSFLLKDQIQQEVASRVQRAVNNGTFQELYNSSWERVKDMLA